MIADTELDPISQAILHALAGAPHEGCVSLPWLGKQVGGGASVLMRHLTRMGSATLGGVAGPGWVQVVQSGARWEVHLTPAGREMAAMLTLGAKRA